MICYPNVFTQGKRLTEQQYCSLKKAVEKNASDTESRGQLIAYLWKQSLKSKITSRDICDEWLSHVVWFIENSPDSEILYWPEANRLSYMNDTTTVVLKQCWQKVIETSSTVRVLQNAASFFSQVSLEGSLDIAMRGLEIDSNSEDLRQDCITYLDLLVAKENSFDDSLGYFSLCEKLLAADPENPRLLRILLRRSLHTKDLYTAKQLSATLLAKFPNDHLAHTALGIASLEDGDLRSAKEELLKSTVKTTLSDSPFDFALAETLLNKGEKETVCAYLQKCWKLWPSGRLFLLIWIVLIRLGVKPRLFRFV